MAKKQKGPKPVKVSAKALLTCIQDIRESLAACKEQGDGRDMLDFVESALDNCGIPELECVELQDEYGFEFVGPRVELKKPRVRHG